MSYELALCIGFLYSIIVGAALIYPIMHLMWDILRVQARKDASDSSLNPNEWQTVLIGVIERSLYLATIAIGRAEFVALWLTLKTVSQSKRWSQDATGRAIYNNFLVGNGLSILFSLVGAGFIYWAAGPKLERNETLAALVLIAPIVLAVFLIAALLMVRRSKRPKKGKPKKQAA